MDRDRIDRGASATCAFLVCPSRDRARRRTGRQAASIRVINNDRRSRNREDPAARAAATAAAATEEEEEVEEEEEEEARQYFRASRFRGSAEACAPRDRSRCLRAEITVDRQIKQRAINNGISSACPNAAHATSRTSPSVCIFRRESWVQATYLRRERALCYVAGVLIASRRGDAVLVF
jgi:hypothetical protein